MLYAAGGQWNACVRVHEPETVCVFDEGGLTMERLTIRTNEASISFECESVGDIVRRLAAIEDILGDEYDLDRLKEAVKLIDKLERK